MQYSYRARDPKGQLVTGDIDVSNSQDLKKYLSQKSLILIEFQEASAARVAVNNTINRWISERVSIEDILMLYRQMQTIYAAGVPLLMGLKLIGDQAENKKIKKTVEAIIYDVSEGLSLNKAAAKHPDVFSPTVISLLEAGETSGQMELLLERMASYAEQQHEYKAKVSSATLYPRMIAVMIVIVFTVLVYFVIPQIQGFYKNLNAELPAISKWMMAFSGVLNDFWYLVITIVGGSVWLFKKWVSKEPGNLTWDRIKLKSPVIGKILLCLDMNTFCTVFVLMMESGLPINETFRILGRTLSSLTYRKEIERVLQEVLAGKAVGNSLAAGGIFPGLVVSLVKIGEESGRLPDVLKRLSDYYRVQSEYRLTNLSKAIEPIMLVIVFGIVLVFALSVFLPLWKMSSAIRQGTHK